MAISVYARSYGEVFDKYSDIDTLDLRNVINFLTDFRKSSGSQAATTSGLKSWIRSKISRNDTESLGSTDDLFSPGNIPTLGRYSSFTAPSHPVLGVIIHAGVMTPRDPNKISNFSRFSQRDVDPSHSIWRQAPTEPSRIMGLPLLMFRLPADPRSNPSIINPFKNDAAVALNLDLLPIHEENWGLPAILWKECHVGNVLVVRADGKNLDCEQVYTLVGFVHEVVKKELATMKEETNQELWMRTKEEFVQKWVNWKTFEDFLEVLRAEKIVTEGERWKEVKSPFDM